MDHGYIQVESLWRVLQGPLKGPKWPKWQNMTKIMSPFCFFSSANLAGYMAIQIVCWWAGVVINGPYISINGLFLFEQVLCHITGHWGHEDLKLLRNGKKSKIMQQKGQLPLNYEQMVFNQSMWKLQGYIHVNLLKNTIFERKLSKFNQIS